ncbi:MAG: hypothetical protein WC386_02765 [Candidatus Paceibacterota bacterium]|jgi:hypothetical protein
MAKILITRPEHDPLTRHLSYWNSKIIDYAKQKGVNIIDLHKEKANRKEFEGRVRKVDPSLILLNGHGDDSCVAGHDNEKIVETGQNEELLKGRITYAVACSSAKGLGLSCCANQDTAFIGYDEAFILNLDRHCLNNPLKDKRAERFLDPSNRIAFSLLKGHTCQESSENSKNAFKRKIIELLLMGNNDPDALDDAKDLLWNMNHQVCLGNKEKTA